MQKDEIDRLTKLQEEKPKGMPKQFGSEDTEELIKGIHIQLDDTLHLGNGLIHGKQKAAEIIGLSHAAMLDAVYEGASQWESDCKDAQNQAATLRSENERLKGERDDYRKVLEICHLGLSIDSVQYAKIKNVLSKYPNPTT